MAISAGRLTQMISVLNPVLTRNAAGEMTEEWVSCGKIHADIRGRSSRDRILNVVGLPVPDATGGRLEILCRLGGEK